jgi:predicted ATPase
VTASVFSQIHLSNFRGFQRPTDIRLKKITLLFGQNSAGKSTVIKSLLLLQQSFERSRTRRPDLFVFSGESVDLGSFLATVSGHKALNQLGVGVTIPGALDNFEGRNDANDDFSIHWMIENSQQQIGIQMHFGTVVLRFKKQVIQNKNYFVLDELDLESWCNLALAQETLFSEYDELLSDIRLGVGWLPVFKYDLFPIQVLGAVRGREMRRYGRGINDEDESIGLSDQTLARRWWKLAQPVVRHLRSRLDGLAYVGPLREEPTRYERYTPSSNYDVGQSGENMLALLYSNPQYVTAVNNHLATMEVPYEIRVRQLESQETLGSILHMSLVNRAGLVLSPSDVGVGYSQVLPLITQAVVSKSDLVCVEQPELHLHPAMQARLGDVFIDAALGGNNVQFLIETHSESLMLRILRRIREGRLSPDDVSVLYIDQDKNGISHVVDLEINRAGDFVTAWPHGFFDERLDEIGFN